MASHTRNLNFLTFAGECPQLRHQKLERGKAKDTYEVHYMKIHWTSIHVSEEYAIQ